MPDIAASLAGVLLLGFGAALIWLLADRRRLAASSRASEERLSALADCLPGTLFQRTLHPDGRISFPFVNPRDREVFGLDAAMIVADPDYFFAAIHPDDRAGWFAATHRSAEQLAPFDHVFRLRDSAGNWRWMRAFGTPRRGRGGTVVWDGFTLDVSSRMRAETALRGNEARMRAIIDAIPDAVFVKDLEGRYILVNPALAAFAGRPREAIIGRTDADIYAPDIVRRFAESDRAALAAEGPITVERELDLPDGGRTLLVAKNVYRGADGRPLGVLGLVRDMSAHKRMEVELRQAQRLEAIGQLTGGVAHDFNNLLSVILVSLEMLEDRLRPDGPEARHMWRALEASRRGAALTRRLLAFSRRQDLRPRPTDANRLIAGMLELARHGIEEAVTIETRLADDLWLTEIDRDELENALLNLLLNARDAMPDGGAVTIETANWQLAEGSDTADYIAVTVRDTGAGMTPETRERAFDPFFTTKGDSRGTGLGLSMVHGFVTQSGGRVSIDSAPGRGTTVQLLLPRSATRTAAPEPAARTRAGHLGRGEVVLVVEDDEALRETVAAALGREGYRALTAEDGTTALGLLRSAARVDLLFTDVVLAGGMDGLELAEAACARRPGLKVLYTSGYPRDMPAVYDRLDPRIVLLKKPYRSKDLLRAVDNLLRGDTAQAAPSPGLGGPPQALSSRV